MSAVGSFPIPTQLSPKPGEPVWDLALMYPRQGGWSVENYLALDGGLMVEFTDGIVDPQQRTITVLALAGQQYREHGIFRAGQTASSVLLDGFDCEVSDVFAKCNEGEEPMTAE